MLLRKIFIALFLAIILPCFNITVRMKRDGGVTLAMVRSVSYDPALRPLFCCDDRDLTLSEW